MEKIYFIKQQLLIHGREIFKYQVKNEKVKSG